jgi:hypothetical protein
MHPINKRNFGPLGLAVQYFNGTGVVAGYITKQLGSQRFEVTDGTNPMICTLSPTTAIAEALAANPSYCAMSLLGTGSVQYVAEIFSDQVSTTTGQRVPWTPGASVNGSAYIALF